MAATITLGTVVFQKRADGSYTDNTATFSSPANEIRVRPAAPKNRQVPLVASVLRRREVDTVVAGVTTRKATSVQLVITVPQDTAFTPAMVSSMVAEVAVALNTELRLNTILLGAAELG